MARSRVKELIDRYNECTVEEQKLFLDFVAPEPEPEVQKQTRKRRGRSAKAQSLAGVIAKVPKADVESKANDGPNCGICGNPADHSDHDPTYLSSHVFEAPKVKKASGK